MSGSETLPRMIGERPVFRRSHRKADGRMLHLYGHQRHEAPALPEEATTVARGGELRFHPLRQEWNIYAAHRQHRTFKPSPAADPLAPSRPGGPATEIPFEQFELAVFENRFAGLHRDAELTNGPDGVAREPALGTCEVVVYGPEPEGSLATIGQARRELLLAALLDRYEALFAAGCDYVLPFENRGEEVGVTLHHPHAQIYGFDRVPPVQQRMVEAFAGGFDLAGELVASLPGYGLGERDGMAALVPRFARFPYEVWLAPTRLRAGPWDCDDGELVALAHWMGEITRRYDALFERPAATMMAIHAAPRGGARGFHFTVQFYPVLRAPDRVKYLASVEQHTGVFTVDVMPETAVAALRGV